MPVQVRAHCTRDPTFEDKRARCDERFLHGLDGREEVSNARLNPREIASPLSRNSPSLSFDRRKLAWKLFKSGLHALDRCADALLLELVGEGEGLHACFAEQLLGLHGVGRWHGEEHRGLSRLRGLAQELEAVTEGLAKRCPHLSELLFTVLFQDQVEDSNAVEVQTGLADLSKRCEEWTELQDESSFLFELLALFGQRFELSAASARDQGGLG